jgi:Mg2+ and Co2+ transporter CorA
MPHAWRIVKNSTLGGHRATSEFVAELESALSEFERGESEPGAEHRHRQFSLHDTVRESLGLGESELVVNMEAVYNSPYPFMHGHGSYVCGLLSTPTSAEDGHAEFTSLFLVASTKQLLTVILDPPTTYAGPFGQRLINRNADHETSTDGDVGTTILMIIRDNVTSLNFALREITLDADHIHKVLGEFGSDRDRHTFDALKRIEAHLVRLQIEIDSLDSVVNATAELLRQISDNEVDVEGDDPIFDRRHEISAAMLTLQARQTVSVRDRLDERVNALTSKCETLRDKFFVEATHRIGAVAALLLVPTFIVGLYGQNFDFPERHWANGYVYSWGLILVSTMSLFVYFKRKRWL